MSSTPERMHNSWAQQRQGGGKAKPTRRAQYELGQSRSRDAQPQSSPFPALPSELGPPLPPPTESAVTAAPSVGSSDQPPRSRLKELGRSVARKISFGVLRSQQQQQHEPEQAGQREGDSELEPPGPLARIARGVFEEEEEEGSDRPLPSSGLGRITPAHGGGLLAGDTAGLQRVRAQAASQAALIESTGGEEPSGLPHAHPEQGQGQQQQQQEQNPEALPPSSFHSSAGVWERDPRVGKTIPAYYSIASGPRSSSRYSVDVHEEVPIGYERPESVPSVPEIPARFRQEAAYPSSPIFPPRSPALPAASSGSGPYILVHKDELVDAYKQHLTRAIIPQIQHLTDTNNEVRSEIGRIVEDRVATLLGDFHEHLDQRFGQMTIKREVAPPPRRRLTASSESDAHSVRRAESTTGAQAYEARRQHRQHARQQQRQHVAADEQDTILRTTQHLLQRFGTMQTNQDQLSSEVGSVRHEIADIHGVLGDLRRDLAALAKNVASTSHPGSASELQRQTSAAMQELAIIRNDVQAARVEIGAARNDIATVSDHANAARLDIEEARADIQDNAAEAEGGLNVLADMIKNLQRSVADLRSDSRTRVNDRSSPSARHQRQHSRRDFLESQRRFRPPSGPITPFAPVPPVPRYDPPAPPVGAHSTSTISGLASAPATAPAIWPASAFDDNTAAVEEQSFTSFLPLQIPSTPPLPRTSAETTHMQTEFSSGSNKNNDNNVDENAGIIDERSAAMHRGTTVASSTTTTYTPAPAPAYAAPASLSNTTYQEQSRSASSGRVAEMANVFEGNGRFASSSSGRIPRDLLRRRQERGQAGQHRD